MMFKAVTMEREFGGGGSLIARRVAEILGWDLLDRELVEAVAQATHVDAATVARYDERVDSWWRRFHLGGVRAATIEAGMPITDAEFFDSETVAGAAQRVIANAAAGGNCVIVGRGGQCLLQGHADVLHVFVYGPCPQDQPRVGGVFRLLLFKGKTHQSTHSICSRVGLRGQTIRHPRRRKYRWRNP